ncbi:MAG TPA: C1 family peptidase [Candidatus Obscuribacterales bacterium]
MKSLIKFILPAILLSACAGQSLPPTMAARTLTSMSAPRFGRMSAPGNKLGHGLGAIVEGTQPMVDDSSQPNNFLGARQPLPAAVDLRPQFQPIYNQGGTNACVGYSSVGGLGEFMARKRGWNMRFSPRYLWNLGRKAHGMVDQNVGIYLEDAIKIMDNLGMAPETSFPFASVNPEEPAFNSVLNELPGNALIEQAKKYRISQGWERISSVHAMKQALAAGKPVVFAIMIFSNINSGSNGMIPLPGPMDEPLGGHAITAVGYDNARRVFIIRNSWGTEWGDKGYGYLPYDFFRSLVKAAPIYAGFTVK